VKNEVQNWVAQNDEARTPWRYVPPANELFYSYKYCTPQFNPGVQS
jgi:hypothetical protein